jgi:hypothetical protein
VRWEIARHGPKGRRLRRAFVVVRDALDRSPFVWSAVVQALAFLAAWVAGAITLFPHITFDIGDPSDVIATAWQVLAGFASIAFAGLAVLMQLTSEPVVTSRGVREVLFRESQFRPVLAFSIVGAVQIGAAALFLNQPESAVIEIVVVACTILWIGWSYARVGKVYANPGEALRLGERALTDDLRKSMREARARAIAESRLYHVVPRDWRWGTPISADDAVVLAADHAGIFSDVDIDLLGDIVRDIADDDESVLTASAVTDGPGVPPAGSSPELCIVASLGSSIEAGQELFVLKNPESYSGDLARLRSRLSKALRWEETP